MKEHNPEYNKELILAHQFLKKQHQKYLNSTMIKNEHERLQWAHAVQITEQIATHCNITPKDNPQNTKRPEYYNTIYNN